MLSKASTFGLSSVSVARKYLIHSIFGWLVTVKRIIMFMSNGNWFKACCLVLNQIGICVIKFQFRYVNACIILFFRFLRTNHHAHTPSLTHTHNHTHTHTHTSGKVPSSLWTAEFRFYGWAVAVSQSPMMFASEKKRRKKEETQVNQCLQLLCTAVRSKSKLHAPEIPFRSS